MFNFIFYIKAIKDKKLIAKITYLYQSGFVLELEKSIIIIDYFKAKKELLNQLKECIANKSKKIYVLVSHSHHDHFNKDIFDWTTINSQIKFILSTEINANAVPKEKMSHITFLDKLETFEDKNIIIKAFGSTDIGASFYIESEELKIFHAGDLNNWHWNQEFSIEEAEKAENYYLDELSDIKKCVKNLDILFFPLDPRLGIDYLKGVVQFISQIKTSILIPMHFGENYLTKDSFLIPTLEKIDNEIKFILINKEGYQIKL